MNDCMKKKKDNSQSKIEKELDEEFVLMLAHIEAEYEKFNKHIQIRIEKWVEKLVSCDENLIWKRNRNNYIKILAEMVEANWVGIMFSKMPP